MTAPRLDAAPTEEAPRPSSPWWSVHVARYRFAANTLQFNRLLDVACGTGYGLAILAGPGRAVIGVDLEAEAVSCARKAAPVVRADASALPFRDNAFDAITSFETIEHLHDRRGLVDELARVLTPDGELLLSTPNALYTQPIDSQPRNPFHVFEYKPEELLAELGLGFEQITLCGQQLDSRFVISPFEEDQQRMPSTPRTRLRILLWRVINKLPAVARDGMSWLLWRHPLYPRETDYVFAEDRVGTAPVLVANARVPRRRNRRTG